MTSSTASAAPRDLAIGDPDYPARIGALDGAPPRVSVAGAPIDAARLHVAIVGTRAPSDAARTFAHDLAAACAASGAIVVSGGAVGIDAAAHLGALDAGGRTVAVLGTGRDHVYPAEHGPLYARIAASRGALVWPFAPGARALPGHFPRRNRVLVALADVVVVVQAPARSGALNAARHARDLGRPLWAVLAGPWDRSFAGSARLIEQGARPLTTAAHFLDAIGLRSGALPLFAPLAPRVIAPLDRAAASVPVALVAPPTSSTHPEAMATWVSAPTALVAAPTSPAHPENAAALVKARPQRGPKPSGRERPVRPVDDYVAIERMELTRTGDGGAGVERPYSTGFTPESDVLRALSDGPRHVDEVIHVTGRSSGAVLSALLTLVLAGVLVEGPQGFYRCSIAT